jgi:DNA-binding winged helix-turn-helix (wHTH) protein/tetratricopeptide (TPR) repeat protein
MSTSVQSNKRARFSSYGFNLKTGDLTRSGVRLRLESQPAKVLGLLIEAKGSLVSRSQLIAALWPGEVEGDFDRRLDKAVAKLRARLNDDPAKPRYIETLKGRGYCFVHEVTIEACNESHETVSLVREELPSAHPVDGQSASDTPEALPASMPSTRGLFQRPLVIRAAGAMAALALAVSAPTWWLYGRPFVRPPSRNHPVVLILGFRNLRDSAEDAWLSHAVTEWLSADLDAGGELQLVQATMSIGLQPAVAEAGCSELPRNVLENARQAFNADMIVYGEYAAIEGGNSGDRLRLNVCLDRLWDHKGPESMTVIGTKGDISELVSDAGELLRSKLGLKHLSRQSLGYLRATLPSSPAAARLYAEGTSALDHFEPQEAVALLTQAAQLEPQHAPTHAALSTSWAALGYQLRSQQEALRAKEWANSLSPTQQLEYSALAYEAKNDWAAAVDTYSKLLELHPDSIGYALKLAHVQTSEAKVQFALETLRALRSRNEAAQTDPRVDLAEAAADSASSDFRGQLAASTRAESRAKAQGSGLMVANAQMEQGNADDMLGNWTEAMRLWRLAGQSYESIGDRGGMADALNRQAALAWKKGDATNAAKRFEDSISLSKAIDDHADMAYSLSRLGVVRMATERARGGEMPEAVEMFHHAASIYHTIGNTAEEGYVLSLLGDEAMQRSRYEEARSFYGKAMALSHAANDQSRVAGRLLDLGIVALSEGHNPEAEQYFQRSSQAFSELGERDRAAIARVRLGVTLYRSGKLEDAESMLEDSLATMRSFGRINQVREVLGDLTEVELLRNPAKAEILSREGLHLDEELLGKEACAGRYTQLAEAELAQGRLQKANEAIQEAFRSGEKVLAVEPLPNMLLARGDVRVSNRDYTGASADFTRSLVMARARGARFIELTALLGLAELHFRQNVRSAKPEFERLRREADQLGYGIFAIRIEAFLQSLPPQNKTDSSIANP